MTESAAKLHTLEDVMREHREIRRELEEFKRIAQYADENAEKAHKRIDRLEKRLDDISLTLETINTSVKAQGDNLTSFDKKQDVFMSHTWQLIKWLLLLLAGIITVLGGLVGVKLTIPL